MSFFTKKNFLYKLIVCICIFLTLLNFVGSSTVYGADKDNTETGGILINPVSNLLLAIGDALMDIMQKSIMGAGNATIKIDVQQGINWGAIVLGVIAAIALVALWIIPGTQGIAASVTMSIINMALAYGAFYMATGGASHAIVSAIAAEVIDDIAVLPTYAIGPEEIFSGRILLFDANIFNPKELLVDYNIVDLNSESIVGGGTATIDEWKELSTSSSQQYQAKKYYYKDSNGENVITSTNNSAYELRDVISKWYYIIRNISLVATMIVLLYIGIKMMTSSIAADKAKYRQMLSDWVIAVCLIVLMHYIMIFAHSIVESITNIFNNMTSPGEDIAVFVEPNDKFLDAVEKLEEQNGVQYIFEEDGEKTIKWPTNMMGRFRVEAQNKDGSDQYLGYALAYLALVLYTLIFSFTYIKRLLYLLFLTVIAPLVALTYPIDKIHDGKAQAFNMWLKEYIFNLIIQPFHLLLYTIFVTMAFEMAGTNVIYSLVVIGFMVPAEKFLRNMFGFNKASTPGLFAGAAGAALTMSAVNTLGKFARGGSGSRGRNSGGKESGNEEQGRLRTANSDTEHSQEYLFSHLDGSGSSPRSGSGRDSANAPENTPIETPGDDSSNRDYNPNNNFEQEGPRFAPDRSALDEFEAEGGADNNGRTTENDTAEEESEVRFAEQQQYPQDDRPLLPEISRERHEPQSEPSTIPKPPKGKWVRSLGKSAVRAMKNQAISDLKAAPRTIAKIGAGAVTATTLGSIGAVSGIVSGDPSTAVKNAMLGASTGVAVSSGVVNRISNTVEGRYDKSAKERLEREVYGSEYTAMKNAKADEKFRKDKEIRALYKRELGLRNKEEVETAMNQAVKYREFGVNDNEIIIKAMKLENGNATNRDSNRRIAAAKLAENSKNLKDYEANMKRFGEAKGVTKDQVEDMKKLVKEINNL